MNDQNFNPKIKNTKQIHTNAKKGKFIILLHTISGLQSMDCADKKLP